jgi:hypothetical protein
MSVGGTRNGAAALPFVERFPARPLLRPPCLQTTATLRRIASSFALRLSRVRWKCSLSATGLGFCWGDVRGQRYGPCSPASETAEGGQLESGTQGSNNRYGATWRIRFPLGHCLPFDPLKGRPPARTSALSTSDLTVECGRGLRWTWAWLTCHITETISGALSRHALPVNATLGDHDFV